MEDYGRFSKVAFLLVSPLGGITIFNEQPLIWRYACCLHGENSKVRHHENLGYLPF